MRQLKRKMPFKDGSSAFDHSTLVFNCLSVGSDFSERTHRKMCPHNVQINPSKQKHKPIN